jgi:UDP-N-acetyl-D-glucosamine dehydrogenase
LNITVIGLGKIGLPLAVYFSQRNNVIGLDNNKDVVEQINNGQEPFPGEKNLKNNLKEVVALQKLSATLDVSNAIKSADVILICVPLIIDSHSEPDFLNIDSVVTDIGKHIVSNTLIVFETTLPVGTTRNRFSKSIEKISNLEVGKDIFIVFSPERVLTGRVFEDLVKYPKLVGGVTSSCTEKGVEFYKSVLEFKDNFLGDSVWALENCETAEFTKIAETTYRDVNIGLANEFAIYAKKKNINITQVIQAANSQPYSNIHTPGISVGGHCIPVYPHFYLSDNPDSTIVYAARIRNESMPGYTIEEIKNKFPSLVGMSIGILGVSYRTGVKEAAFSGALTLLKLLKNEGAIVFGYDPFFTPSELKDLGFECAQDYSNLNGIIIHTAHDEFHNLNPDIIKGLKFIFDGRNVLHKFTKAENIFLYLHI